VDERATNVQYGKEEPQGLIGSSQLRRQTVSDHRYGVDTTYIAKRGRKREPIVCGCWCAPQLSLGMLFDVYIGSRLPVITSKLLIESSDSSPRIEQSRVEQYKLFWVFFRSKRRRDIIPGSQL
jgi:hypothetical protein